MQKEVGMNIRLEVNKRIIPLVIAILLGVIAFFGQDKPQPKQSPVPVQTPMQLPGVVQLEAAEGDHILKPGDVVDITVEKAPELSGSFVINDKGTFIFPVLGLIKAEDKTAEDLSQTLVEKLKGSYLTNPIVSVNIKQIKSKSKIYFIQGAVRNPGTFQIEGHPSLLKLITIAGGLSDNYGSTAFVIREKKKIEVAAPAGIGVASTEKKVDLTENKKDADKDVVTTKAGDPEATAFDEDRYELLKVNIATLLRGNFEQNITIQSGDIVHIPKSDIFFVAGEVVAPGTFQLREGTTLRQAVSLAQGTKYEGATDRGIIFREDQLGKRQEIAVDIGAVMAGKKTDIDIMPNDIIMVPNSKSKTIAKGMLKTVSNGVLRTLLGF